MYQLLPEITGIFEQYLKKGEKVISPPASKEWREFVSLINKVDEKSEKEINDAIGQFPVFLKSPLVDALNTKKNNDRVFSGCVALLAFGKEPWKFIKILYSLELLDFSIILIDDIIDKAERRGNNPCHHIKWGIPVTLSISESIKSILLKRILNASIDDVKKINILNEINFIQEKVYEGQLLDIRFEEKNISDVSISDYLNLISLTTGYQIRGCFRVGGILAEAENLTIDLLSEIGLYLGVIGQIRDDLVDYIPEEDLTWKRAFSDFRRNKKRLPLIIGWKNATPKEKKEIIKMQQKKLLSIQDQTDLLNILFKPESLTEIKNIISKLKKEVIGKIRKCNISEYGKKLVRTYLNLGVDEI